MKVITKQDLLDFGMVEDLENPYFPLSKNLAINSDDSEEPEDDFIPIEDDFKIAISLYHGNNQSEFVLNLPEGMVYLGITSINDLKFIEKMVLGYENYN